MNRINKRPSNQALDRQQALELIMSCEPAHFECLACRLHVDGHMAKDKPLYIDVSSTEDALTVCLFEPIARWPRSLDAELNSFNNKVDRFKYHVDNIEDKPYFMTTAVIAWEGTVALETFDRWLDALLAAHQSVAHYIVNHVAQSSV